MNDNDFGRWITRLIRAFKLMPGNIVSLSLSSNKLGNAKNSDLLPLLETMSRGIRKLDLSNNNFLHKTSTELARIMKALPPKMKRLILDTNQLGMFSRDDLHEVLSALPQVKALSLSDNQLGHVSHSKLAQCLKSIPKSVTDLNLSFNDLDSLKLASNLYLGEVFASLYRLHLTKLNLSHNNLGSFDEQELTRAFVSFPTTLTSLDLSGNLLGSLPKQALLKLFQSLPANLTTLNLSGNNINLSPDEWKELLKVLPKSITKIIVDSDIQSTIETLLVPQLPLTSVINKAMCLRAQEEVPKYGKPLLVPNILNIILGYASPVSTISPISFFGGASGKAEDTNGALVESRPK